jgi:hypothetical protein
MEGDYMPKAPAKPILKLRKSSTGTKHTVNEKRTIFDKKWERTRLNPKTPEAKEWSKAQLEKLRKIGKENEKVRKSQQGVLEEYYKKSKSPVYNREPVYKPRGVFVNVPIAEIRLDPKTGTMVFTQDYQGRPKKYRITREELLTNNYYQEVGLFNSLLESRKYSFEESSASVKKRIETKKQKIIDVARFLKIDYLKNAGVTLDSLITAKFTLPEIIRFGGYSPAELHSFGITDAQIQTAREYNVKNTSKFDKNDGDFV